MPSFFDYLVASTKEFRYRIRTVVPIDDIMMDRIEYLLSKYDVVSIDGPKKTIMQANPLDFTTLIAAEIYILDIVTHIPISPFILQQELKHILGTTDSMIVVRGENDPTEIQATRQEEVVASDLEAMNKDLRKAPLLSNDPRYPEYETVVSDAPIAGNEYTKRFLKYLAKVAAERLEVVPPVQPENKKRMFSFLDAHPIDSEYYRDEPYVKPMAVKPGAKIEPLPKTSPYGNFDDTIKGLTRTYVNKNGDEVVLTAKKV
jgi:hypothetical protein